MLATATPRALDLYARTGVFAEVLREHVEEDWAADGLPLLPDARTRRFVLGELPWLHQHPRLRADASEGFDLVFCGTGLWRFVGPTPDAVREALVGALHLLRPGGRFAFVAHLRNAPRVPGSPEEATPAAADGGTTASQVTVLRWGADGVAWEVRAIAGLPPVVLSGPDLDADAWVSLLRDAGFVDVAHTPLDGCRTGVEARRG